MNSSSILYDYRAFSSQPYGGVSRLFYELIRRITLNPEFRIHLFQGFHINRFPLHELKKQYASYSGKQIFTLPHINFFLERLNRFLFDSRMKGNKEPAPGNKAIDIFHPTGYSSSVSEWRKSPVVLTICDMIPELFPDSFNDIRSRLDIKKKCIKRADKIIAISDTTRNDLISIYNINKDKIHVIYPGSPFELIKKGTITPYSHGKSYILYVGTRRQAYKNFESLLVAYSTSSKVNKEFDLICFGGAPLSPFEREIMAMMNSLDNVFHIDGDDSVLAGLYAGASALVYPSLYEGFGLPPLEAMAHGCPVITAEIPVLTEVLGDAAAFFNPLEPESIISTLENVLASPSHQHQLREKGFEQIKKYSWDSMTDETISVYKSLIQ